MARVYIPHRIPPQDQIKRIVNAGMASQDDVDALLLVEARNGSLNLSRVIMLLLDGREQPWVEDIDGTLEIIPDDESAVVPVTVEHGIAEVPEEHVQHVLSGIVGSYVVGD